MQIGKTPSPVAPTTTSLTMLTRMFWPEVFGGVERRTRHMAEVFTEAGVEVRVVTGSTKTERAIDESEPGYVVDRARLPEVGWRWRWRDRVVSDWWAWRLADRPPPGWIWATDLVAASGAVKAGLADRLIFNPPWCVAGMHRVYEAHRDLTTLRCRKGLHRLEQLVYRKAHMVVGASRNVIDQLCEAYGPRQGLHVVPHGVAPVTAEAIEPREARRQLGIGEGEWVAGLVCRVEAVKDIGFLLRAMAKADGAVDRLLIVGEGPDLDVLASLASELGVGERVIWAGRLDDPTSAYRAMDVMVLPSIYEAFGNVTLEAMAAGVPVIGRRRSDDPGCPVLVANEELIAHGDCGWLVDAHDPADLATTLSVIKQYPAALADAKVNAAAQAAQFTWAKTIGSYLDLLGSGSAAGVPPTAQAA